MWAGPEAVWHEEASNLSTKLLPDAFLEQLSAHIPEAPKSSRKLAGSRCRAERDLSEEQGKG